MRSTTPNIPDPNPPALGLRYAETLRVHGREVLIKQVERDTLDDFGRIHTRQHFRQIMTALCIGLGGAR